MKNAVFLTVLLLIPSTFANNATSPLSRRELGRRANQALLNLNFYMDGKGMFLPAGFPPMELGSSLGKAGVNTASGIIKDEFGLIVREGEIVGLSQVNDRGQRVSPVGCAVCHSGKAAGFFIPGLGNKNVDVMRMGEVAKKYAPGWIEQHRKSSPKSERAFITELENNANHFFNEVTNPQLSNQTQGLVAIGLIRKWFFDQANEPMDSFARGQVKVPSLWGYGEKRKVGSFSDGGGDGVLPGWAVAVELVAGQTVENVRKYEHKIHKAEDALAELLPPPYPFEVNQILAQKGARLFENHCKGCHGTYSKDLDGLPIYEAPKHISLAKVKTDSGRLEGITEKFREMVRINPLNDLIRQRDYEPGYFAPRLVGIWARYPYLHNGSVPNLFELLLPESQRSEIFSLKNAGERSRFDLKKLGLRSPTESEKKSLKQKSKKNERWVYDTNKKEHSNQGHEFRFYSELSDEDRFALIEHLKTL